MKFIQNILKKVGQWPISKSFIRVTVTFSWSRRLVNDIYIRLTPHQKNVFHSYYAKIFRGRNCKINKGNWHLYFRGKKLNLPLRTESMWLDWDTALSVLGHGTDVKETYLHLINSQERPELFIDVGANYGTHSLLFLVNNIRTISFEPNNLCNKFHEELCLLNGVATNLEPVALGEFTGNVELSYPASDTWLGSTDNAVINDLAEAHELITEKVEQKKLDDYFQKVRSNRLLIKIDTEGNELSVLRGSDRVLRDVKPKVIFESWNMNDRIKLYEFWKIYNYQIYSLPYKSKTAEPPLEYENFLKNPSRNFIAIPYK